MCKEPLKESVTISFDDDVFKYFKKEAEHAGVSFQALINMYLKDCVENERHLHMEWK